MPKEQPQSYDDWEKEYKIKERPKKKLLTRKEYLELKAKENSKLQKAIKGLVAFGERISRNQRLGLVRGLEDNYSDDPNESVFDKIGKRAMETRP